MWLYGKVATIWGVEHVSMSYCHCIILQKEQTSKLKVSLRSFEIPVVPAMDRFPSDLHENIGPDHVACNPFIDLYLDWKKTARFKKKKTFFDRQNFVARLGHSLIHLDPLSPLIQKGALAEWSKSLLGTNLSIGALASLNGRCEWLAQKKKSFEFTICWKAFFWLLFCHYFFYIRFFFKSHFGLRRMARNPFTGFIQHSVCSTTSQIRRGRPIVIQPSQLSVGFVAERPVKWLKTIERVRSLFEWRVNFSEH